MRVRLGEVCEINMGQSPASSTYNEEEKGLPFFQGNADFGEIYPTARIWCDEPTKVAHIGDILISVRAPIGALNLSNCKCCIGRGLAALTVNKNICLQKYLWYVLAGKNGELNSKGTGSTFKAINKNILAETEIPLPSLDEQHKIVMLLDKVSGVIAERRKQVERLDDLVKSRFVEMFGDPIQNPMGWEVKSFKEMSTLITDGEHTTPQRTDKGVYLLSARNILNHSIQVKDVDFIDRDEYNRIAKRIIPKEGDVLISCSGSIGRCCAVPPNFIFQMVRSVALIRFCNDINPIFAEWMIASDDIQRQIANSATQSSQANLFQSKIQALRGYKPPIELQNQFAAFVQQTDKLELVAQKSLEKLEILKKSLMQQYFG